MNAMPSRALGSRRLSGLIGSLACGQGREDPGACWMGCDLGSLWPEGYQSGWHGNAEVVQEAGQPRPLGAT